MCFAFAANAGGIQFFMGQSFGMREDETEKQSKKTKIGGWLGVTGKKMEVAVRPFRQDRRQGRSPRAQRASTARPKCRRLVHTKRGAHYQQHIAE